MNEAQQPVIRLTDGIWFKGGPVEWSLPAIKIFEGQWCAVIPDGADPIVDPASAIAQIFATLSPPIRGVVELLGNDIFQLPYRDLQRLRSRLGYVQGYGGLLSNRTIKENIALPLSVHGKLSIGQESTLINNFLEKFSLSQVKDFQPHEVDGYTRWRACIARAMVLSPKSFILEGIGDWEMDRGRGVAWTRIREYHEQGNAAVIICLSRQNPEFELWFEQQGGLIVKYSRHNSNAKMGSLKD